MAGPTGVGATEETDEESELSVFVDAVTNVVVVAMDACVVDGMV